MARRTPRRPGRRLGIADPDTRRRLLEAIRGGVPLTQAVIYAGISERALFRTLARGEAAQEALDEGGDLAPDDALCREFWREVREARSQVAVRNVALVQKAAQGGYVRKEKTRRYRDPETGQMVTETEREYADVDWRASKWLLEASFAREFSTTDRLELTGLDGGPVRVEQSADQIVNLSERLALVAAQRREDDDEEDIVDAEIV